VELPQDRRYIKNFDLLRFAAAMWVVYFHYGYQGWHLGRNAYHVEPGLLGQFFFLGFLGVTIFFGISGFFLVEVSRGGSWRRLLAARILRIAPAFWIGLCFSAVSLSLLGAANAPTITRWLANLTLIPQLFGEEFVDGAYWSLVYEVIFYCWVVALVGFGVFHRYLLTICMIWLAISVMNLLWLDNKILERVFITTHSAAFVFGILLSHIRTNGRSLASMVVLLCAMIVMVPGIEEYAKNLASAGYELSMSHLVNFTFPIFMYSLLTACLYLPDIPLPKSVVVYLGGLSYPLYLVHQEVGFALFDNRPGIFPDPVWIALSMAIVILLASLVYRLEIPFRRTLTDMVNQYENRFWGARPAE